MWPEFAALLRAQRFAYDLYVTLTGSPEETAPTAAAIRTAFPRARVWAMPNRGRDILPFLHLAQSGVLAPYAAVCKLHGKKSPIAEMAMPGGSVWRGGCWAIPIARRRGWRRFWPTPPRRCGWPTVNWSRAMRGGASIASAPRRC
ncbi:rhamnan synthesis F family protein [Jhaorihella thermophila]